MNLISNPKDAETRKSIEKLPELLFSVGHNFIVTEEGHFGLGSPSMEPGDIITVILGCPAPIALRPVPSSFPGIGYHIVGSCYVHGFSDAEALLGPMPEPWETIFRLNSGGVWSRQFRNRDTGEQAHQDPRLGPLPTGWESVETGRERGKLLNALMFRKKDVSGGLSDRDPRMTPESLTVRGVRVENLQLV